MVILWPSESRDTELLAQRLNCRIGEANGAVETFSCLAAGAKCEFCADTFQDIYPLSEQQCVCPWPR